MNKLLIVFAISIAMLFAACSDNQSPVQLAVATKPQPANKPANKQADLICIAAVGDIMLGTSYPNKYGLPPDSAKNSLNAALPYLKTADVAFGNLEGVLLDSGIPRKLTKPYLFRMPPAYASVLKNSGFNLLSVANNHVGDFGDEGRANTVKVLDSTGINYAGLLVKPTTIFKLKGITYGFCAFAPNSYTVPILNLKKATQIIQDLKKQVDIVIVSFHSGGEGPAYEHVPFKTESYLGENRGDVCAFAHNAIDAGADVVFGNGPHVSRAMERYKNRLIAYSLGNFCTYKSVSVAGVCGMAPLLKVYLDKNGVFLNGQIIALRQSHLTGLQRDTSNAVVARIKSLTQTDFPKSGLNIADDGQITSVD